MKQENQVSQTERQILKDMEVLRKAVMVRITHISKKTTRIHTFTVLR